MVVIDLNRQGLRNRFQHRLVPALALLNGASLAQIYPSPGGREPALTNRSFVAISSP